MQHHGLRNRPRATAQTTRASQLNKNLFSTIRPAASLIVNETVQESLGEVPRPVLDKRLDEMIIVQPSAVMLHTRFTKKSLVSESLSLSTWAGVELVAP